jgi:hypothetical protein
VEIYLILCNGVPKIAPMVPVLGHITLLHIPKLHFFKILFNIISSSAHMYYMRNLKKNGRGLSLQTNYNDRETTSYRRS